MIKTVALVLLALTSLILGGLLVQEKHQAAQLVDRVAKAEALSAKQQEEIRKARSAVADLEQKRGQLVARNKVAQQALVDARNAASTPASDASPTPAGGDGRKKKSANPLADSITKMMKDPAMKNMMRTTQGTVLKQMYGDLVKGWALSPDETQTFYDLLLDKQMDQMDLGMNILEKGPDAAKTTDVGDPDAKLKAALGDNLYKQYQDYQKTISGRLTVNRFQQQLATGSTPALTPDQSSTLLQTITEETANLPPGIFSPPAGGNATSFSMSPGQVDQYMKAQGDLDDRIDARMANTLSPDQLQVLKEQQQQMIATQRMGMEMAAKMMAPSPTP